MAIPLMRPRMLRQSRSARRIPRAGPVRSRIFCGEVISDPSCKFVVVLHCCWLKMSLLSSRPDMMQGSFVSICACAFSFVNNAFDVISPSFPRSSVRYHWRRSIAIGFIFSGCFNVLVLTMKLGIIGCGAIGSDVAIAAESMPEIEQVFLFDADSEAEKKLQAKISKGRIMPVADFLPLVDVVFEGASQEAVEEYAVQILSKGIDFIIMSVGSLFDDTLRKTLAEVAQENHCKLYVPSGAVCGIDGLISASMDVIDEVTLVTTKPPASLGKNFSKRTVVYEGMARKAIKKFPKNINVAASVSLTGIGFDNTIVKIVADPVATRINHKILAHGKFGRLRAEVENMPNPNNPKSSYMASLSAIAMLKKIISPIQIG